MSADVPSRRRYHVIEMSYAEVEISVHDPEAHARAPTPVEQFERELDALGQEGWRVAGMGMLNAFDDRFVKLKQQVPVVILERED